MVNRFTQKAQSALTAAKKCAEKMGHSYIGSEHLILGILSTDCIGNKILDDKKIRYDDVFEKLSEIAGTGGYGEISARELTPKCKKIIESASASAKRFSCKFIGTEHILYSICDENDCVGARILFSLGINLQMLKNEICGYFDSSFEEGKTERPSIPGAPTLSLYGKSLNAFAGTERLDPLIGRETEEERLIQILSRRTKNNPCLIGEPGVGKTALVEGLAQKINDGEVPEGLQGKIIVSLDLSSMIAGAKYRGEFEERMRGVINELKNNDNLILFIDEIHTIIGAGAAEGAVDAANIIKPALARGQIQLIGATTISEYRRHIEKDSALERRFQPILVREPTPREALDILYGLRSKYEDFHSVKITDEALACAVNLSVRYITDRYLPDKAIDLIDEASSRLKMKKYSKSPKFKTMEKEISNLIKAKENAVLNEKFDLASEIHEKELAARLKYAKAKEEMERKSSARTLTVTDADIRETVTQWTSIPISTLERSEGVRLSTLENELFKRVIGQRDAILAVSSSIKRGRAGLKNPERPIGSFLFLGPTGVGKTELAKSIAEIVFGSVESMIRIDMSEYMEKHSISRLIGSPPGYVGFEEGGQLTEKVRLHPYSVVLFDEIEKAHSDIYNALLQILEDGFLTDSQGRRIDFRNTILILTSNIGAKNITEPKRLGFGKGSSSDEEFENMKLQINDALKSEFHPEFLNRLDEIIIFNKLTLEDTEKIASIMIEDLKKLAKDIGINLEFTKSAILFLASGSYNKQYGARPLRRFIMSRVENPLSEKILDGSIEKGDTVCVDIIDDKIDFKISKSATSIAK